MTLSATGTTQHKGAKMAMNAYQKKLEQDMEYLMPDFDGLVFDMTSAGFLKEWDGSEVMSEDLPLVLKCAVLNDFTEFYSEHEYYHALPSGDGFVVRY